MNRILHPILLFEVTTKWGGILRKDTRPNGTLWNDWTKTFYDHEDLSNEWPSFNFLNIFSETKVLMTRLKLTKTQIYIYFLNLVGISIYDNFEP